jgi:hypothetical protein
MNLSPEIRARILASTRTAPAPTRPQVRRQERVLVAAGVALAVVVFLAAGGVRQGPRPWSLVLATSSGTFVIAAVAMWAGMLRGGSMLGRQRALLLAVGIGAPLALLGWRSGISSLFDGMTLEWPTRPGLRCLMLTLAVGVLPLALALLGRRRSDPVNPAGSGAALGVAVGLGAACLVDLWCPVAHVSHVLLGHVLPVALLAAAGAAVGAAWLSIGRGRA